MSEQSAAAIRIVTVTVSDSRTAENDASGKALDDGLRAAGFTVVRHIYLTNDSAFIKELLSTVATTNEAEAVILTGGTGISPRDQTFEAVEDILEKRLDGFGEAFRRLSFEKIGPRAILSRATAGVASECLIFSLPGNTSAVELGLKELIIPILGHAVDLANDRATHPEPPKSHR